MVTPPLRFSALWNERKSQRPGVPWTAPVVFLLPIMALTLACRGGGGSRVEQATVRVEAIPPRAELTVGREFQLGFRVIGTRDQLVRWSVVEPDGGTITPGGLYAAPSRAGTYHAMVQSLVAREAMAMVDLTVHPKPEALALKADRTRASLNTVVNLTPLFQGGRGILYPGALPVESGVPVAVMFHGDTDFTLRVINPQGLIDERTVRVDREAPLREAMAIHAPGEIRPGNPEVAWVEGFGSAHLEWTGEGVAFLGNRERPTTPAVAFAARPGATAFTLRVRVQAPSEPGEGAPEVEVLEFHGRVVEVKGSEPEILVQGPCLTVGKGGYQAKVGNPQPGTTYRWSIRNGAFGEEAPTAEGTEVVFSTHSADHLVLTCAARDEATGAVTLGTRTVLLVPPPMPPVLQVGEHPVAGIRQIAFVKNLVEGTTYHWELDPAQGRFVSGDFRAEGPLAAFQVDAPGPFLLRCHSRNAAGDESEASVLRLTAEAPRDLAAPVLVGPTLVRTDSGPHAAAVAEPVPGLSYRWSILGGELLQTSGSEVQFRAWDGAILLLSCTASEATTGVTATSSLAFELVRPPRRPTLQAPTEVGLGETFLAGVVGGGLPGERYVWTFEPGTPKAPAEGDRGSLATFQAGYQPGTFLLTCTAYNAAGDASETGTFRGTLVARPGATEKPTPWVGGSGKGGDGEKDKTPGGPGQGPVAGPGQGPGEGPGAGPGKGAGGGPGAGPGKGAGGGPGADPGKGAGEGPGAGSGKGAGEGSGSGPGKGAGEGPGAGPGKGAGEGPGAGPGKGAGEGPGAGPGKGAGEGPGAGPGKGAGEGPGAGPGKGAGEGPAAGPGKGAGEGPGAGSGKGAGEGPGKAPGGGPVAGPLPGGEPSSNPAPAPVQGPGPIAGPGAGPGQGDPHALGLDYLPVTTQLQEWEPQAPVLRNVSGGPLRFSVVRGVLPPGLLLDPGTGVITGSPEIENPYAFQVRVQDGDREALSGLVSYIVENPVAIRLRFPAPPVLRSRVAMERHTPALEHVSPVIPPTFWLEGDVPPGLAIDRDGAIFGTPKRAGNFEFTVHVRTWTRSQATQLTYDIQEGPPLELRYGVGAVQVFEVGRDAMLPPALRNFSDSVSVYEVVGGALPPGMRLDAPTGRILGRPEEGALGESRFQVRVTNGFDEATAQIQCRVQPVAPVELLSFQADRQLLLPGERATFTWEYRGLPMSVQLGRNLLPRPAAGGVPDDENPRLAINDRTQRSIELPVLRRQTFTLNLPKGLGPMRPPARGGAGRPAAAPAEGAAPEPRTSAQVTVAVQGLSSVAGNPASLAPAREYASGPLDQVRVNHLEGLAFHGGALLFSEGSDHTVRAFLPDQAAVQPFLGVFQGPFLGVFEGPFEGPIGPVGGGPGEDLRRLNHPGPMAIAHRPGQPDELLLADRGSFTIRRLVLQDGEKPTVLAGSPGAPGDADGRGEAARFGDIQDMTVLGRTAFVADEDHGIRMIHLDTGEVRTLHPLRHAGVINARIVEWPELKGPVGLAGGGPGFCLYITTKFAPKFNADRPDEGVNDTIQMLAPFLDAPPSLGGAALQDVNQLWDAQWELSPFAGTHGLGRADGVLGHERPVPATNGKYMAYGEEFAHFKGPRGLAVVGDHLYVADTQNHVIREIDLQPRLYGPGPQAGRPMPPSARLVRTVGTHLDSPVGMADGAIPTFRRPTRLIPGRNAEELWVIDQNGTALRRLQLGQTPESVQQPREAVATTPIGPQQTSRPSALKARNGRGPEALFDRPLGIAVDRLSGDAYVADSRSHAIRKVVLKGGADSLPSGTVTTLTGKLRTSGQPEPGSQALQGALFQEPSDLGMDGKARLFILDQKGTALRMIDGGMVTTLLELPAQEPGNANHLAVRPGSYRTLAPGGADPARPEGPGADRQMVAYAFHEVVAGVPQWRIQVLQLPANGQDLAAARPLDVATLDARQGRIKALAVSLDSRIFALEENRETQRCTIHGFVWDDGAGAWIPDGTTVFGPATPFGADLGFPDVHGMAGDSRGNLFLTDAANGLVWMLDARRQGIHPVAGSPGVHRLLGPEAVTLDASLYRPLGIAVTPDDDLVVTSGDAVVQITAPGNAAAPWVEPDPNQVAADRAAWVPQAVDPARNAPVPEAEAPPADPNQPWIFEQWNADQAEARGRFDQAIKLHERVMVFGPREFLVPKGRRAGDPPGTPVAHYLDISRKALARLYNLKAKVAEAKAAEFTAAAAAAAAEGNGAAQVQALLNAGQAFRDAVGLYQQGLEADAKGRNRDPEDPLEARPPQLHVSPEVLGALARDQREAQMAMADLAENRARLADTAGDVPAQRLALDEAIQALQHLEGRYDQEMENLRLGDPGDPRLGELAGLKAPVTARRRVLVEALAALPQ